MPHQIIMFAFSIKCLGLIAGAEEVVDTYNTVVGSKSR